MTLYLASTNSGKLREFREAARALGVRVEPAPGMRDLPPCVEDGVSFEANASKKALHYSRKTEVMVFADDSGLCVDALDARPGIYSARYAGPAATDEENNQKLLAELHRIEALGGGPTRGSNPTRRAAHYICVIALAERERILTTVEGRADGSILESPRGEGGFGYDPLFYFPPLGKTLAELGPEDKFKISHRGEAFRKLLKYLTGTPG